MQGWGSHKTTKCFFSSPWRISLLEELLLHAEQHSAAAAQRWWRGPPEQTQCGTRQPGQASPVKFMTLLRCFPTRRPLIEASGSTEWALFVSSVWLSFPSLSCSKLPLNIHVSFPISVFGISSHIHLQTAFAELHLRSHTEVFFSLAATLSRLCAATFHEMWPENTLARRFCRWN